ncbi:MAG: methyltransferase domain-containing protein [Candidatus Methylomirabilis oxyfera]|nr:methyltransferase domain-containing protein [Candidatus Methylomirabilis oxyfera]
MDSVCFSCGSQGPRVFYGRKDVPVHSVLLMPTREIAVNYPKGDIALSFCRECGFIFNQAFLPDRQEYSSSYEGTQAFSPTFSEYARGLAERLIDRYNLRGKSIMEIGCGKGEFLSLLCELGGNRGVGFDPGYSEGRIKSQTGSHITVIRDVYSERYADHIADFICCRMTLEHIQGVGGFVRALSRSIGDRSDAIVFFQVPDASRILREAAFWDIYYEHSSYFSPGSLARLFRRCGFEVLGLWKEFNDQHITIEARPSSGRHFPPLAQEEAPDALGRDVEHFSTHYTAKLARWRRDLERRWRNGRRVVIWGSGSKGVGFLTTLDLRNEIEYAVDVNPYRQGTYMAGTGQKIVPPAFLSDYRPDVVIVMNSVYAGEIRQSLNGLGLTPELIIA